MISAQAAPYGRPEVQANVPRGVISSMYDIFYIAFSYFNAPVGDLIN